MEVAIMASLFAKRDMNVDSAHLFIVEFQSQFPVTVTESFD
jgi:hypothetical protein